MNICKYCKKNFCSKQRLKSHIEKKVCRKYHCDKCNLYFRTKNKYEKHCSMNCQKEYKCIHCNFTTKYKSSFSRHMNKTCKVINEDNIIPYDRNEIKNKTNQSINQYIDNQYVDNRVDNSVNNNTFNIHINNFCNENSDYIKGEALKKLLEIMHPYDLIIEFIKCLNFNDSHPENHTMEMVNVKKKKIAIINNGVKEIMDRDKAYQMKILNADNIITDKISDGKKIDYQYNTSAHFLKRDINRFDKEYGNRKYTNYTDIRTKLDSILESHKRFGKINQHPELSNHETNHETNNETKNDID